MTTSLSPEREADLCGRWHWASSAHCSMPKGHSNDYHAGWTAKPGTPGRKFLRYWDSTGVTEQLVASVWQPTNLPGPRPEELLAEVDRLRGKLARVREQAELSGLHGLVALTDDPELPCQCGHSKLQHQDASGLGGAQCKVCPGDQERSWRHPYTAAVPAGSGADQ